jgi:phosphohistidine phosphatase
MKRLYLIRHAKSSWDEPGLPDIDRPVIENGVRKTKRIISFLNEQKITADLIVSSPAERAYQTAVMVAEGIGYPVEKIKVERKVYEDYYDRILDLIYATPDEVGSLMIFGHNPTITHLANLFLHPGIELLPTTGVVCISFNTDEWEKIPSVEPKSEFVITPKMLKK